MSPGVRAASSGWKRQKTGFILNLQKGMAFCQHLDFSTVTPTLDVRPTEP